MIKASRPPFFTTFFDALQGSLKKDTVFLGQRSKLVLNYFMKGLKNLRLKVITQEKKLKTSFFNE